MFVGILKLVLAGRMGEAIEMTSRLYPGLLEHNQNLLFMLKCRQFVEMVNGTDSEVCPRRCGFSPSFCTSPRPNSPIQTSVIQSTKSYSTSGNNTPTAASDNKQHIHTEQQEQQQHHEQQYGGVEQSEQHCHQ